MNMSLKKAMRLSRADIRAGQPIQPVLDAEKYIACAAPDEFALNRRGAPAGFVALWTGLRHAATGAHEEACREFLRASEHGCSHWRIGWYLAQSARASGNLPLLDEACAAILRANPEFWFARELPKHARGFYAQGDQDRLIETFFADHPPRARVFVEVGAFDGVHYSNVRRLVEKQGWTGVSIEPAAKNFAKLTESYRDSQVTCIRACVSDQEGEVELNVSTYPHLPDWGSDVASVSGEDTERWRRQYGAIWTTEKVPARRLTRILDDAGITDVDLLSVDAEGHDLEVLRSLDFDRFQPQLIVIEYGKHRDAILRLLNGIGYQLAADNKQDLFMTLPRPATARSSVAPVRPADGIDSHQTGAAATTDLEHFPPSERDRILAAVNCHDCDDVPKVAHAGEIIPGDPPVQLMHNGVRIIKGSYHGDWMTEIIRRLRGHHEPQEEKVFHELLKTLPPGSVMIEAGSFWAYYSMWFQAAVPGARNFLIEPNREKFQLSQRHFALNGMKGVFTNAFVGKVSMPDSVFTDWDGRTHRLPQITIDDYVRQNGIEFVHVLHADIQGAELDLLHGAMQSIAGNKIGCLVLSTHGDRHPACLDFLAKHGFRIIAQHTIAEGAAADGLIVASSSAMAVLPEVSISRRRQTTPPPPVEPRLLSSQEVPDSLTKLNPHLLNLNVLPLQAGIRTAQIDPIHLVTPERFDILAKHIYARHRSLGVRSDWARGLYQRHIGVFSGGTFREGDGRKNGITDYLNAFDTILASIGTSGFDSKQTLVPVGRNNVIIDGAHRVAACLLHGKPVGCLLFDHEANRFDAGYFLTKGLSRPDADALAIEYCQARHDSYVVHLFPKAEGRDADARAILREHGDIVYEKELNLRGDGPWWLVRQLYRGEKWIGTWSDGFAGARRDALVRFGGKSPLRIIVFRCDDLAMVREAKARIRALYGHGNYSSHINDSHEETLRLARLYFNANGVHFLNHAHPRFLERFETHLERYRHWLAAERRDPELFCVDGSAVMAAYGLRDVQDLDVLHFGEADFSPIEPEVNSHNAHAHHHLVGRDELIFNPEHHFHYDGLKFVSLAAIRAMKARRSEGKDLKDVALMDPVFAGPNATAPATASPFVLNFSPATDAPAPTPQPTTAVRKDATRIYYVPNGNDYHIAALLNEMFTEVKPFGCRDVQDYIERRILAYQTTDASQQLWNEVQAMKPDLVYLESGKNVDPATLQRIRTELGVPVTMWFGDACVNGEFIERLMTYAPCVDWQIVVDRQVAEVARERGLRNVEFIPFFGYDHYFYPLNTPKTLEIFFSGKSYDNTFAQYPFARARLAFVRRVNTEFGRRLAVVGENWDPFGLANYVPERVPEWEVNELNNHAKIVLAFDAAHIREFTSCRTYHALLGRSFVLIRKFPGIENLFINGEHLVWFESADEGIALLHHYLNHPDERERIAEGGFQHVHRNGWKFSNVVRYLVDRGLKRVTRGFEEIHTGYSRPLPQPRHPIICPADPRPELVASAATRLPPAAQSCLDQAESFFNAGRLEDARDWLERALDLAPDQTELLLAFANLSLQLNAAPAAEIALKKAAQLKPADSSIRVLLASAQYKQGNVEAFEETLTAVLRENPADPFAVRFLAQMNLEHGRFKEAANGFFKLLQQNEEDIESLLSLGVCFHKTGDRESAAMMFNRLLQLQPDHALARENLSACAQASHPAIATRIGTEASPQNAKPPGNTIAQAPIDPPGSRPKLSFDGYHQPPAGSTERAIAVHPLDAVGATKSAYQALKNYTIRDFGTGLDAARAILAHILKSKLKGTLSSEDDFWTRTIVLPVRCELRGSSGRTFVETKPATIDELGISFAKGEDQRRADIENYTQQIRAGADLGNPLYVSGTLLKKLAPKIAVDPKAIYMMDGARRIAASALAHQRFIDALFLLHEEEYEGLSSPEAISTLRDRLATLQWFERYQSIPMLGLHGERTLRRFDLMSLPLLRDAVVMDFGCNTGQACLKAAQAGARQVIGIEGMADTCAGAREIARLSGFTNVSYANINFNDADFAQQIDAVWRQPVDYAFFFSVYRTKELTQREQLFRYILAKARKGVFFEGHAAPKIDTLEYYQWLFECFGVRGTFLGYSEGELRPLFFIDLTARGTTNDPESAPSSAPEHQAVAQRRSAVATPAQPGFDEPLVSAIVSTYNNERFMEGRLRDLVAQTLGERLEIIVVDSGSQQNEGAIVRRFMEKHSNIRYIRTEERERIYQAWNRGIRAARGKYITNANTDDRLRPDALEILAGELDGHPEIALVYADFFITNTENEDFLAHTRTGYSVKPDYAPGIMLDGCHMGPQPMWRRSLHEEIGWFDESLFAAGDYDFWCRAATKHPLLHLQEFLGLYLHNAVGICNSNTSRTGQETSLVRERYRSQFPPPPANLPRGFYYRDAVPPGRFVNIGMVTFNRLEFTKRAIPALLEHTDFPHVLTVVDNASTDGTREYLTALKQLGVIKNLVLLEENAGVAKASNLAWSLEPAAEFYLKLDNDIVIQKPGWLRQMVETLEAVTEIGAIAYSFEPRSYPAVKSGKHVIRPKPGGTLGGACVLIPKRTQRALGGWCEDYGLYGEEDFDYGIRILSKGLINAYMEDEAIGIHLPNGRAAVINDDTMVAKDGLEEWVDRDYRQFKDEQRRQQVLTGKRDRYEKEYRSGARPLFVESGFAKQWRESADATIPQGVRKDATSAATIADERPLRVAVFSLDHPATACAVLRLIAPLSRTSPACKIAWCANLTKNGAKVDDSACAHADIVVIQRMFPGPEHQEVLNRIFASGKPIVYELDDWFFDMPADNPHTSYATTRLPFIEQVIRRASVVTVSTEALRDRMAERHPNVVVLPNLINEQLWPSRLHATHEKIIIGYAGTATHGRDLAMVERALEKIAQKHRGKVGFVFLGCGTERLLRLPDSRVVEFQHGYGRYVQTLQSEHVDIALAPLADNPFNRCKSHIKWVEYSAAEIAGVYSDIPAYRGCVRHGENGLLAGPSSEAWFNAIDELVTHETRRRKIATRAREDVMREHTLAAKAKLWKEVYSAAAGRTAPTPSTPSPSVPSGGGSSIPSVSIVIPTFNNLALTQQCLAALHRTTPVHLAEIIVVDNGSVDGTVPFLEDEQRARRLRAVLNGQNLGFARGCNQGALEARGEFVLFLNNDTQPHPGWIDAMLAAARDPQVGVVGARLLYPDGTIQHAGIDFINGVPDHPFRHAAADSPEVIRPRELDMVTGACLLTPKSLFLELGGFDEVFLNGVEDVDLCLRVRTAGRKIVYEPGAVVTHHEGKSQGRFNHVTENLKIFFTRWKTHFDGQHRLRTPKRAHFQKAEKSLLRSSVSVSWDGSFLDLGSLSHVNRELTAALGRNHSIQLTRLGKNAVPKQWAGMKPIIECARTLRSQPPQPAQVTVRHAWPPNWERPAHGAWVLIQPWEFGALPKEWVHNLARVDEVWVPSEYARRVYLDSGVEPDKVHVVPNGIDPKAFSPGAKPMNLATKKSFKFLFVGGTIVRKGPDVLLKAYLDSFTSQDDVCLVIKDFGGQSVYAGQTFEAQIKAAQADPQAPEILYLNEELSPEALPGLYTACDCLVHPYRGEGFGLPVLEAMACGLPVVVTAGGSTDDFATDEFAFRIPSIRRGFGSSVSGMELIKPGWMLEPDHTALVERLKWIAANRNEAKELGRKASAHAHRHWTWEQAAQRAAARLVLLNASRPASAKPVVPRKPKAIELPPCARLGHLSEARELFRAGKLLPAWNATIAALNARPYNPEAFLLLAEIALAAGHSRQASELGDRARRMAPKWKPAREFAKKKHPKSTMARLDLPALPRALTDGFKTPRLSVFLIARNEEQFIGQCLESVREMASQIVVVDTGSTDWTRTIAERFGAEVVSIDWSDDFSAARNTALEKVTGDWVLMLDADEEFLPDQQERLCKLLNDSSAIAWRLPMIDKGREAEGVSHVPRLFRNAPGLFYLGRIHEQIFSSVEVRRQEWGLENKFGDATLLHHGYTKEMVRSRDKVARNLRLLQLAIEELPGEPNLLMNLGLELARDGRVTEGLEHYATAFAAMCALPAGEVTPELRESLLTQYASQLISAKRPSEVIRILQSPIARSTGLTASMHWLLGLAFIEEKRFREGAAEMRECLSRRDSPVLTPMNRNILKGGPNHCLALCLAALKQTDAADKEFKAALKEDPEARSIRFDYARFLIDSGHEVDALKSLHELATEDPSEARVWQLGAQVALSRPEYLEFAGDWTPEAHRQHPNHPPIVGQRATVLLLSGDFQEASRLWHTIKPTAATHAALILCAVLMGQTAAPVKASIEAGVGQEFVQLYRLLLTLNAEKILATLHQRLERLAAILPAEARLISAAVNEASAVPSK